MDVYINYFGLALNIRNKIVYLLTLYPQREEKVTGRGSRPESPKACH